MLVIRIGFDSLRESTPRSMEADSPPAICRRRRCEVESSPVCRKTKGSVSARLRERLLVMVVVNAGRRREPSLLWFGFPTRGVLQNQEPGTRAERSA